MSNDYWQDEKIGGKDNDVHVSFATALLLLIGVAGSPAANAASNPLWHITKTEWTQADEAGFGAFVRAIAESGCPTTTACLHDPANPYRDSDHNALEVHADCAKWVYTLRAYYAWKNGLPFGYVGNIAGAGSDLRFSDIGNRAESRRELVDRGDGLQALSILSEIHDQVSSATYRVDASKAGAVPSDFYSPKIQPGSIRPGTVIYDINGHVAIVYAVETDGCVRYMGADPDNTVTRSVYGAQFGQGQARLGGGFKNFRPLKLVGAVLREDGTYVGGHIVLALDNEITDFSLEQYRGTGPDANGDGANAVFRYNNIPVDLFEYVRGSLSEGAYKFDPVYELKIGMDGLCQALQERSHYVDAAIQAGMDKKPEPDLLPGNIYASNIDEWEAHASPGRDASLKDGFVQLDSDIMKLIFRAEARNPGADASLRSQLLQAYREKAQSCTVTYTNGVGVPVTFGFDEAVGRLFAMSFDPYQCVERRWGATDAAELASCKDDEVKAGWYRAEQNMRNQVERSYSSRAHFTLAELELGGPGSGEKEPPSVDIAAMIANIGHAPLMAQMSPVGF